MSEENNIPKHWKLVKVGEFVISVKGKKPKRISSEKTEDCSIPYVNIKAFEKNVIDEYTDGIGCVLCEEGDFLMVWDGSRSGYVGKAIKGALGSTLVKLNFPNIDNNYAYYFLQSKYVEINTRAKGVGIPHVDPNILWNYNFPIPSPSEQLAIVSKIEELLSDLENGKQQLQIAQQQLKIYRQSLLEAAFIGTLSNEWRSSKIYNVTYIDKLKKQIHIEKEIIAKATGFNYKIAEEISGEEISEMQKLPSSWCWIRPEEISSPEKYAIGIGPFGSNLKVSDYKNEGIPLIFVKNITRNDFTRDLKFISEEKFKELFAHSVQPLDIVITKMGDPPGDCTIYPENSSPAILTSDCLKFRVWDKFANRKFYKYCIETNMIKKQLGLRTKGVAQKKISAGRFKTILFPFTSLEEQNIIVDELESKLTICDKIEETISQSLLQAESLRQSILKKAFEGKLL